MLGRQEEIKPLGQPGQYVNFPSTSLLLPFFNAMNYPSGNPELVKLLLEAGAEPALCNVGGQTALDLLMMFINYGNITLTPNLLKV